VRQPALIFDLDGTLVDSVYQHVAAWHDALRRSGLAISQWRIHRAIGMSGSLFLPKLLRGEGIRHPHNLISKLEAAHDRYFDALIPRVDVLPGSTDLLNVLKKRSIPFAIATSGSATQTKKLLARIPARPDCIVVTADDVETAKPAPDLFEFAAERLAKESKDCFVVGDSVWDVLAARRMPSAAIALKCGGFEGNELQGSGAYRVYEDPQDLRDSLEQLGFKAE
jgi:HAD superfamily hydrolase (TIGR01509 family)